MRSLIHGMLILVLIAFPRPPNLFAQYGQSEWRPGPRERRAEREKAVKHAGPQSRDFIEAYGEEAIAAIYSCSQVGVQKMIEFHAGGGLDRLSRPHDLLRAVARPRHGDDVVVWVIAHESDLIDPDRFDAFVHEPLEYALGLKQLADGVEELRVSRLRTKPLQAQQNSSVSQPTPTILGFSDPREISVLAGIAAVVGLLIWWRRRRRQM